MVGKSNRHLLNYMGNRMNPNPNPVGSKCSNETETYYSAQPIQHGTCIRNKRSSNSTSNSNSTRNSGNINNNTTMVSEQLINNNTPNRKRMLFLLLCHPTSDDKHINDHRRTRCSSQRRNYTSPSLPRSTGTCSTNKDNNRYADKQWNTNKSHVEKRQHSLFKFAKATEGAEFTAASHYHTKLQQLPVPLWNISRHRSVSVLILSLLTLVVIVSLHINCVNGEDTAPFPTPFPSNPAAAAAAAAPTIPTSGTRFTVSAPTMIPTIRRNNTNATQTTTSIPTLRISDTPTSIPTNALSLVNGFYRQPFRISPTSTGTHIFLNDTEVGIFTNVLEGYTPSLLTLIGSTTDNNNDNGIDVGTNCSIDSQVGTTDSFNRTSNIIDYRCQYSSRFIDVTNLPDTLLIYLNNNLTTFTTDLQQRNINVDESFPAIIIVKQSPAPSISPRPSIAPSVQPTFTGMPSLSPSSLPTETVPTPDPAFIILTTGPMKPLAPTIDSNRNSSSKVGLSVVAIVAIVIVGGLLCLAALFMFYRSMQKPTNYGYNTGSHSNPQRQERRSRRRNNNNNNSTTISGFPISGSGSRRNFRPTFRSNRQLDNTFIARPGTMQYNNNNIGGDDDMNAINNPGNFVISPTDSHLSNKSLLSTGDSVIAEGSGDNDFNHHNINEDGTKNLQDEFDLYKDQNLELLRTDVEGNLSGFEGYMSAAVTNALMGDDEKKNYEIQELLWGCDASPEGTEIEASALFEVTDWLNRNESAGTERKGAFMQEILNKMVTSVRFGVIIAEDASRTIHESAAILGLQLAEDLPVTTVIISGMRKTTRATDIMNALNEFGDIDVAAVASGKRGFGIVRFRRRISVDHALQQYRAGEIVILDVSIQMKVLMPNGVLESR